MNLITKIQALTAAYLNLAGIISRQNPNSLWINTEILLSQFIHIGTILKSMRSKYGHKY